MKGILLPRNYLKFPLLKIIVRKIASKSLITSKNSHFLRMDHRNLVHENVWRDNGDIICIKNLFNSTRVITRTNCWAIWNCIGEGMDLFSKRPAFPPLPKKNETLNSIFSGACWQLYRNSPFKTFYGRKSVTYFSYDLKFFQENHVEFLYKMIKIIERP